MYSVRLRRRAGSNFLAFRFFKTNLIAADWLHDQGSGAGYDTVLEEAGAGQTRASGHHGRRLFIPIRRSDLC